jgi:hypothetical protein
MNYLLQNHISNETSLEFVDFLSFYETRREALKSQFMQLLNVKKGEPVIVETEEVS